MTNKVSGPLPPQGGGTGPGSECEAGAVRGQKMDERLRWFGDYFFRPFLWAFEGLRISPNLITCLGMALAVLCGYLLSEGLVPLAAVMFALSGVLDLVDGYIAKKLDKVTVFGSFLDSFSDRVSDAAMCLGLTVYYLRLSEGVYVGLSLVVLVLSFLISYVRARAEGLGVACKAGLMVRSVRLLLLGAALFFNGLSPWVLRGALWLMAVLLAETLVQRLLEVWRSLRR